MGTNEPAMPNFKTAGFIYMAIWLISLELVLTQYEFSSNGDHPYTIPNTTYIHSYSYVCVDFNFVWTWLKVVRNILLVYSSHSKWKRKSKTPW